MRSKFFLSVSGIFSLSVLFFVVSGVGGKVNTVQAQAADTCIQADYGPTDLYWGTPNLEYGHTLYPSLISGSITLSGAGAISYTTPGSSGGTSGCTASADSPEPQAWIIPPSNIPALSTLSSISLGEDGFQTSVPPTDAERVTHGLDYINDQAAKWNWYGYSGICTSASNCLPFTSPSDPRMGDQVFDSDCSPLNTWTTVGVVYQCAYANTDFDVTNAVGYDSASVSGPFSFASLSDEEALITQIGGGANVTIGIGSTTNPSYYPNRTFSVPMTNCAFVGGDQYAAKKIIFMRDTDVPIDQFTADVGNTIGGFESIDPWATIINQKKIGFYADLQEHPSSSLQHSGDDFDGSNLAAVKSVTNCDKNAFLYLLVLGSPNTPAKYGPGYTADAHLGGVRVGNNTILPRFQSTPNIDYTASVLIHESGHAVGHLWDTSNCLLDISGGGKMPLPNFPVANCTLNNSDFAIGNTYYGAVGLHTNYPQGAAASNFFVSSNNSLMSYYLLNQKDHSYLLDIISCGYIFASVLDGPPSDTGYTNVDKAHAQKYWPQCLTMAQNGTVTGLSSLPPSTIAPSSPHASTQSASPGDVILVSANGFTPTSNAAELDDVNNSSNVIDVNDISSDGNIIAFNIPTSTPYGSYTLKVAALQSPWSPSLPFTVTNSLAVTLDPNASTVFAGSPVTLTWSSGSALSCRGSGTFDSSAVSDLWNITLPTAGSVTVSPGRTSTFVLNCFDISGVVSSASTTVTVVSVAQSNNVNSSLASVAPTSVTLGSTLTLTGINLIGAGPSGVTLYPTTASNPTLASTSITMSGPGIFSNPPGYSPIGTGVYIIAGYTAGMTANQVGPLRGQDTNGLLVMANGSSNGSSDVWNGKINFTLPASICRGAFRYSNSCGSAGSMMNLAPGNYGITLDSGFQAQNILPFVIAPNAIAPSTPPGGIGTVYLTDIYGSSTTLWQGNMTNQTSLSVPVTSTITPGVYLVSFNGALGTTNGLPISIVSSSTPVVTNRVVPFIASLTPSSPPQGSMVTLGGFNLTSGALSIESASSSTSISPSTTGTDSSLSFVLPQSLAAGAYQVSVGSSNILPLRIILPTATPPSSVPTGPLAGTCSIYPQTNISANQLVTYTVTPQGAPKYLYLWSGIQGTTQSVSALYSNVGTTTPVSVVVSGEGTAVKIICPQAIVVPLSDFTPVVGPIAIGNPYLNSISPSSGPVDSSLTLFGYASQSLGVGGVLHYTPANYSAGSAVIIRSGGQSTLVRPTLLDANHLSFVFTPSYPLPLPTAGTIYTMAVDNGGIESNQISFTVAGASIASISPSYGGPGTIVTVSGTNFSQANMKGTEVSVLWTAPSGDTQTLTPLSTSGTSATFAIPAVADGVYTFTLSVAGVPANPVTFTVANASISAISPSSALPGALVVVTGQNIQPSSIVRLISGATTVNITPVNQNANTVVFSTSVLPSTGATYQISLVKGGGSSNTLPFSIIGLNNSSAGNSNTSSIAPYSTSTIGSKVIVSPGTIPSGGQTTLNYVIPVGAISASVYLACPFTITASSTEGITCNTNYNLPDFSSSNVITFNNNSLTAQNVTVNFHVTLTSGGLSYGSVADFVVLPIPSLITTPPPSATSGSGGGSGTWTSPSDSPTDTEGPSDSPSYSDSPSDSADSSAPSDSSSAYVVPQDYVAEAWGAIGGFFQKLMGR